MNNWLVSQKSGLEKVANQDTKTFDIEYTKWVASEFKIKDKKLTNQDIEIKYLSNWNDKIWEVIDQLSLFNLQNF